MLQQFDVKPSGMTQCTTCALDIQEGYAVLTLNRPERSNAVSLKMLDELVACTKVLTDAHEGSVRALVLAGRGRNFCSGLDLETLTRMREGMASGTDCPARTRAAFRQRVLGMQAAVSALEQFRWPVIAAVQGACFGAGVDLITSCDIRVCASDARFCVKEVDLAITADLGTLQRLPPLVGDGRARELALTARTFSGEEALQYGLVTSCHASHEQTLAAAVTLARTIAGKPPLAVAGTKAVMLQSRRRAIDEGLEYVALWNSAYLLSHDLDEVFGQLRPRLKAKL